jgi:hypothetical protein
MPYYHVTYTQLNLDSPTAQPDASVQRKGKPKGLWYAEGEDWIKVLNDLEEEDDVLAKRFNMTRPPRGVRLKYEFPLDGKFVDDINTPALDKIFRLTSANMDAFESKFQTYFTKKLSEIKRDIEYYNRRFAEKKAEMKKKPNERDLNKSKEPSPTLITISLKKSADARTPYLTAAELTELKMLEGTEKVSGAAVERAVQNKLYTLITSPDPPPENSRIFTVLRLVQYGDYYEEVMKPVWGGIDYDKSLFTDELKAKYPYIQYVEIPSGCLWHPKEVMPGYVPTPVQGGKRTRRKKLRKSTRRRKQ